MIEDTLHKEQTHGPTLRYFKTPADFCKTALEEAMALFPEGAKLKLLLSYADHPCDFVFPVPFELVYGLPRGAWMLISDDERGDIFYCPGA